MQKSLQAFGQAQPIIIDEKGKIIGGNGTFLAMQALNWTECETILFDGTEIEAAALGIALNQSLAKRNEEQLINIIGSLPEELQAATGFNYADFEPNYEEIEAESKEKKCKTCPECGHKF